MHDYWIGDRIWIASLQKEGIFEGHEGDHAIVKIGQKKERLPFSDISLIPEEEEDFLLNELYTEEERKYNISTDFPDTLDLHISELKPEFAHAEPAQILAHQLIRLREFLRSAIQHGRSKVTIIHGRGEGVLRSEVLKLLDQLDEISNIEFEPHGGSVVVQLQSKSK